MTAQSDTDKILLICTVGGSPEPIIKSILTLKPEKICFLASENTEGSIKAIIARCADDGFGVPDGAHETSPICDPQSITGCLEDMQPLKKVARSWRERGDEYRVVLDFTGGTKCMSSALMLLARRLDCTINYVGGTLRNKDGVGVVVTGSEQTIKEDAPGAELGILALEDAVLAYQNGEFGVAERIADEGSRRLKGPYKKRLLSVMFLASACNAWDLFDHKGASKKFSDFYERSYNDFIVLLPESQRSEFRNQLNSAMAKLNSLCNAGDAPSPALVHDLIANAVRRAAAGRYDDATARLYRAVEALGQFRLKELTGYDSSKFPVAELPEEMAHHFSKRKHDCELPLQRLWELLLHKGDEYAQKFEKLGFNGKSSPLGDRNASILAHGFKPITERSYSSLERAVLSLTGLSHAMLPRFPELIVDWL